MRERRKSLQTSQHYFKKVITTETLTQYIEALTTHNTVKCLQA